jgi:hypothetical protein
MRCAAGDEEPTTYCPLDLFSENETRIRQALDGLWQSWLKSSATFNNLRIFYNGRFLKNDVGIICFDWSGVLTSVLTGVLSFLYFFGFKPAQREPNWQ